MFNAQGGVRYDAKSKQWLALDQGPKDAASQPLGSRVYRKEPTPQEVFAQLRDAAKNNGAISQGLFGAGGAGAQLGAMRSAMPREAAARIAEESCSDTESSDGE